MFTLRPYQAEAVQATIRYFQRQKDPAVLVLPTGAGKSLVIAELARKAKGRVLILAHVKELVDQNHQKYQSYGAEAGIFSAGLDRKDSSQKVIFGSIQSVARASVEFFQNFSLLIIDECHRVSMEGETQYASVIRRLKEAQPGICILGLTATPYRLGLGWIYQYHARGQVRSTEHRFFKTCIFELSLRSMLDQGFLTMPVTIDAPVAAYDFSRLRLSGRSGSFALAEVEALLKDQGRMTPVIVENIREIAKDRNGIMIFTASVRHAEEIVELLAEERVALVTGETPGPERDRIIEEFKARKIKFLVNVSVLTTGFDAPHVDIIAILRPTESVSLFQQIVGRGLRLSPGKTDCLILDYTGQGHNVFHPEIDQDKEVTGSVPVQVSCPDCEFVNDFWGLLDPDGEIIEHFGRKCQGATQDPVSLNWQACGFRFRFKRCPDCGAENDIAARICHSCQGTLVDTDKKLKEAMSLKDAHVMRPDSMQMQKRTDKRGQSFLEVQFYDDDGQALREFHYLNSASEQKAFYYNFLRMHLRRPEVAPKIGSLDAVVALAPHLRLPLYVIARKKKNFWEIREKIFDV